MELWCDVVLALVIWFIVLELIELFVFGFSSYLSDIWNWLDWVNFAMFFVSYQNVQLVLAQSLFPRSCQNEWCKETGVDDDHNRFDYFNNAKQTIGINATLQLLKIVQFTNVIVPKMSLLSRVLENCAMDITFFSIIFLLSLYAFANMFYVLLGTNIGDFFDMTSSLLAMFRSLFGDFDVDEIEENSADHTNAMLFLVYLFVAVFILLSMFLAILADAQSTVTGGGPESHAWEQIVEDAKEADPVADIHDTFWEVVLWFYRCWDREEPEEKPSTPKIEQKEMTPRANKEMVKENEAEAKVADEMEAKYMKDANIKKTFEKLMKIEQDQVQDEVNMHLRTFMERQRVLEANLDSLLLFLTPPPEDFDPTVAQASTGKDSSSDNV